MLGDLGPCGRPLCCGSFLGDFQPVSIKMAKEQNLSLNPTKISGVCGRLMCCLKFEEDNYEQTRKNMPKLGKEVETADGYGVVIDLNVLKETVTVRVRKGDSSELKTYPVAEVRWFKPPQPIAPKPRVQDTMKPVKVPTQIDDRDSEVLPEMVAGEEVEEVPVAEAEPALDSELPDAVLPDEEEAVYDVEPLTEELPDEKPFSSWQQAVEEALKSVGKPQA